MMTQNSDFSLEQVDIIESIREKDGIPGVSAAIVKDGEIIAAGGFGYRNRDADLPMTAHTVSPLCSLTKSFTGVAVMQLVDAGKLSLDEPVASYLPNFRVADIEASRKITPRILLCHKSGMGDTGHRDRIWHEEVNPYKDRADLVAQLAEVQLQTPPNATYAYSNEGYITLAVLIETVSGIPLEDYFQTHIFDAVGMERTYSRFSQWRSDMDRSHGYEKKEEGYEEVQLISDYSISLSTGGICSTAYDYANYLIASMDYVNNSLLSAGSLDADCAQVPPRQPIVGGISIPVVDAAFVRTAHARGMPVQVWTVNDEDEMQRLLDLGVDGIMSDRVTALKGVFEGRNLWRRTS